MIHACRLFLLFAPLMLAGCNPPANAANRDFNAAGQNLGQGHIGSGTNDIGQAFSNGANATGEAISSTAHKIGQSFSN